LHIEDETIPAPKGAFSLRRFFVAVCSVVLFLTRAGEFEGSLFLAGKVAKSHGAMDAFIMSIPIPVQKTP
jgi:hypothetical protein